MIVLASFAAQLCEQLNKLKFARHKWHESLCAVN